MLFVGSSPGLTLPLRSKTPITAQRGRKTEIIGWEKPLKVQFTSGGGLPEWALNLAEERFGEQLRRGLPQGVPWTARVGWFETELAAVEQGWTDEEREEVEGLLLAHPVLGVDFVKAERPPVKAPWPNYDRLTSVEKIMEKVIEDGYDPDDVAVYERENKAREDVLQALGNYAASREESEVVA